MYAYLYADLFNRPINLFIKKIKHIRDPLSHPAKYALTGNGHIGHRIGSKEEQNHSTHRLL